MEFREQEARHLFRSIHVPTAGGGRAGAVAGEERAGEKMGERGGGQRNMSALVDERSCG